MPSKNGYTDAEDVYPHEKYEYEPFRPKSWETSGYVVFVNEETVEEKFNRLVERWRNETGGMSSPMLKISNPNYSKILKMDSQAVLPLILQELKNRPDDWFFALRVHSEENPIDPQSVGDFELVRQAWLEWGKRNHYL